jgi:proteasome assembly chaperone (PAC2) family protein
MEQNDPRLEYEELKWGDFSEVGLVRADGLVVMLSKLSRVAGLCILGYMRSRLIDLVNRVGNSKISSNLCSLINLFLFVQLYPGSAP